MSKIDDLIREMNKKYTIIVGFPKDKQVVYGPSNRKEPPKEPRYKKNGEIWKTRPKTKDSGGQTVAQVASWNEYGTTSSKGNVHTPSRPFLRTAERENRAQIRKLVRLSFDPRNIKNPQRLNIIGEKLVAMVRKSITDGNWIPNAPYTRYKKLTYEAKVAFLGKGKGADQTLVESEFKKMKPLIDTGLMRDSVTYDVIES